MSSTLGHEDLVAMAKVSPEIDKLNETRDEWWLGMFGLDKLEYYAQHASTMWPCWRDGFSYDVSDGMNLRVEPFEQAGGAAAVGVVLQIPVEKREKFIGWARGERVDDIRGWVDKLNNEMGRLRAMWRLTGKPGSK